MSEDLTPEEKALLAEAVDAPVVPKTRRRKVEDAAEAPEVPEKRDNHARRTPAQFQDDGLSDVPVQMRG